MFTGIIESVGKIKTVRAGGHGSDCRFGIDTGTMSLQDTGPGDSIAVSGVCLTAVELRDHYFEADVSAETLSCTTAGSLKPGDAVNLEKALLPTSRLGGHFVSGHVDGVGQIVSVQPSGESLVVTFTAPAQLMRFVAVKGSIAIDGVSLTVNDVKDDRFRVNLVPHTQERTTFSDLAAGRSVNIEVDLLARYISRFAETADRDIDQSFLERHGYA